MARQTKALVKEAEALGIDVDGRWGDETLQEHIDVAKANAGQEAPTDDPDAKAKAAVAALETEARGDSGGDAATGANAGGEEGTVAGSGELAANADGGNAEGSVSAVGADVGQSPAPAMDAGVSEGGAEPVVSASAPYSDDAAGEHRGPDDDGPSGAVGLGEGRHDQSGSQDSSTPPEGATDGGGGTTADHGEPEGSASGAGEAGEADVDDGGAADDAEPVPVEPVGPTPDQVIEAADDEERQKEQRDAAWTDAKQLAVGPINAALSAACVVAGALANDSGDILWDARWLARDIQHPGDWLPQVIRLAVPFVRGNREAPPEALFITMRDQAPELGHEGNWRDLPAAYRFAWEIFRDTLIKVDELVAIEAAREPPAAAAERERYKVDEDEKTLQLEDDTFALSDTGKAMAKRAAAS